MKPDGTKCLSGEDPEIDHNDEWALGGPSTRENCQVVCRKHNQEKARERFGAEFIERKIAERRAKAASDAHHEAGKSGAKVVPAPDVATSVECESPVKKNKPPP